MILERRSKMKRLINIQAELKAPKNQRNNFGGYNYRSCEDILEAVKPLLTSADLCLIINDEIVNIEGRFYVKATATIFDVDGKQVAFSSAFARESDTKKGMDDSQITGATSSYARKYALNGLFCIDDTKDADATNTHDRDVKQQQKAQQTKAESKANFEERFAKAYQLFKSPALKYSYALEESFKSLMAEAEKRKYDDAKQEEMWEIFNSLPKDSLPTFTTKGA